MSGIKSTSIVVLPCWPWRGMPSLADGVNATAWVEFVALSSRLTFPPTTVAYCAMRRSPCVSAIADSQVVNYWSENLPTGAALLHPFRSQPGGRISHIAEMDWSFIRQAHSGPCSAALTWQWRCNPARSDLSARGLLTTWNEPFPGLLAKCCLFAEMHDRRMTAPWRRGPRRLGSVSWENSPSVDGTGSILAGAFPGRGVSIGALAPGRVPGATSAAATAPGDSGPGTTQRASE